MTDTGDDPHVVRHEEELDVRRRRVEREPLRVRTHVDAEEVSTIVGRDVEEADVERRPAEGHDSGEVETLPDGSISIPLLEERLVVSTEVVVRERIIVRKRRVTEDERVEATLRREHVDVEHLEGDAQLDRDR